MIDWLTHLPTPVAILLVIAAICVIVRWGSIILLGYALWHLAHGQWTAAVLAFGFACFLGALRAPVDVYDALVRRRAVETN